MLKSGLNLSRENTRDWRSGYSFCYDGYSPKVRSHTLIITHTQDAGSSASALSCCRAGVERLSACITDVTTVQVHFVLTNSGSVYGKWAHMWTLSHTHSVSHTNNMYTHTRSGRRNLTPLVIHITTQDTHCHTADNHWEWFTVDLKEQQDVGLKSQTLPLF